jgi:hypothetical protein
MLNGSLIAAALARWIALYLRCASPPPWFRRARTGFTAR